MTPKFLGVSSEYQVPYVALLLALGFRLNIKLPLFLTTMTLFKLFIRIHLYYRNSATSASISGLSLSQHAGPTAFTRHHMIMLHTDLMLLYVSPLHSG